MLATFLVASIGGAALAVTWNETPGVKKPDEVGMPASEDSSQTAVGVRVVKADVSKLSYEVPLYVTCASDWIKGTLTFPTNYSIKNKSSNADGSPAPIGVVGAKVYSAPGNNYWVLSRENPEILDEKYRNLSDSDPNKRRHINVYFNGVSLPSLQLNAGKVTFATLNTESYIFGGNDNNDSTYYPILNELNITLSGRISNNKLNTNAATAIFQIQYFVSFLDPNTNRVIGSAYESGTFTG